MLVMTCPCACYMVACLCSDCLVYQVCSELAGQAVGQGCLVWLVEYGVETRMMYVSVFGAWSHTRRQNEYKSVTTTCVLLVQ